MELVPRPPPQQCVVRADRHGVLTCPHCADFSSVSLDIFKTHVLACRVTRGVDPLLPLSILRTVSDRRPFTATDGGPGIKAGAALPAGFVARPPAMRAPTFGEPTPLPPVPRSTPRGRSSRPVTTAAPRLENLTPRPRSSQPLPAPLRAALPAMGSIRDAAGRVERIELFAGRRVTTAAGRRGRAAFVVPLAETKAVAEAADRGARARREGSPQTGRAASPRSPTQRVREEQVPGPVRVSLLSGVTKMCADLRYYMALPEEAALLQPLDLSRLSLSQRDVEILFHVLSGPPQLKVGTIDLTGTRCIVARTSPLISRAIRRNRYVTKVLCDPADVELHAALRAPEMQRHFAENEDRSTAHAFDDWIGDIARAEAVLLHRVGNLVDAEVLARRDADYLEARARGVLLDAEVASANAAQAVATRRELLVAQSTERVTCDDAEAAARTLVHRLWQAGLFALLAADEAGHRAVIVGAREEQRVLMRRGERSAIFSTKAEERARLAVEAHQRDIVCDEEHGRRAALQDLFLRASGVVAKQRARHYQHILWRAAQRRDAAAFVAHEAVVRETLAGDLLATMVGAKEKLTATVRGIEEANLRQRRDAEDLAAQTLSRYWDLFLEWRLFEAQQRSYRRRLDLLLVATRGHNAQRRELLLQAPHLRVRLGAPVVLCADAVIADRPRTVAVGAGAAVSFGMDPAWDDDLKAVGRRCAAAAQQERALMTAALDSLHMSLPAAERTRALLFDAAWAAPVQVAGTLLGDGRRRRTSSDGAREAMAAKLTAARDDILGRRVAWSDPVGPKAHRAAKELILGGTVEVQLDAQASSDDDDDDDSPRRTPTPTAARRRVSFGMSERPATPGQGGPPRGPRLPSLPSMRSARGSVASPMAHRTTGLCTTGELQSALAAEREYSAAVVAAGAEPAEKTEDLMALSDVTGTASFSRSSVSSVAPAVPVLAPLRLKPRLSLPVPHSATAADVEALLASILFDAVAAPGVITLRCDVKLTFAVRYGTDAEEDLPPLPAKGLVDCRYQQAHPPLEEATCTARWSARVDVGIASPCLQFGGHTSPQRAPTPGAGAPTTRVFVAQQREALPLLPPLHTITPPLRLAASQGTPGPGDGAADNADAPLLTAAPPEGSLSSQSGSILRRSLLRPSPSPRARSPGGPRPVPCEDDWGGGTLRVELVGAWSPHDRLLVREESTMRVDVVDRDTWAVADIAVGGVVLLEAAEGCLQLWRSLRPPPPPPASLGGHLGAAFRICGRCSGAALLAVVSRFVFHNAGQDVTPGVRTVRVTLAAHGCVSIVDADLEVQALDKPTELRLAHRRITARQPLAVAPPKEAPRTAVLPPLVPIGYQCVVHDDDTDRFGGGYLHVYLRNGAPGDVLGFAPTLPGLNPVAAALGELLPAPLTAGEEDPQEIVFEGRVVARLQRGTFLTPEEPVVRDEDEDEVYIEFATDDECSIDAVQAMLGAVVLLNRAAAANGVKGHPVVGGREACIEIQVGDGEQQCHIEDAVEIRGAGPTLTVPERALHLAFKEGSPPLRLGALDIPVTDRAAQPVVGVNKGWALVSVAEGAEPEDCLALLTAADSAASGDVRLQPLPTAPRKATGRRMSADDFTARYVRERLRHSPIAAVIGGAADIARAVVRRQLQAQELHSGGAPYGLLLTWEAHLLMVFYAESKAVPAISRRHAVTLLRSVVYHNTSSDPGVTAKTVRVLLSDGAGSTPSQVHLSLALELVDDVTSVDVARPRRRYIHRPAPYPLAPFGGVSLSDDDTAFLDGGSVAAVLGGATKGDRLLLVLPQEQQPDPADDGHALPVPTEAFPALELSGDGRTLLLPLEEGGRRVVATATPVEKDGAVSELRLAFPTGVVPEGGGPAVCEGEGVPLSLAAYALNCVCFVSGAGEKMRDVSKTVTLKVRDVHNPVEGKERVPLDVPVPLLSAGTASGRFIFAAPLPVAVPGDVALGQPLVLAEKLYPPLSVVAAATLDGEPCPVALRGGLLDGLTVREKDAAVLRGKEVLCGTAAAAEGIWTATVGAKDKATRADLTAVLRAVTAAPAHPGQLRVVWTAFNDRGDRCEVALEAEVLPA